MSVGGIADAVAGEAIVSVFGAMLRRLAGRQIQITSPRHGEILQGREPPGANGRFYSYRVEGRLKHLPSDHEIWLLTEDPQSRRVWPQDVRSIDFNKQTGVWHGKIVAGTTSPKIHAVVAPPTSQDLFRYYRSVGTKTDWAPLNRVPVECVNRAQVQARVP